MATARYPYSPAQPPAPFVLVVLASPVTGERLPDAPALLDTGADQTVIPADHADGLQLPEFNREVVRGFDGTPQLVPSVIVRLRVRDLPPFELAVLASDRVSHVVLGRDVLNRYTLTLDGPAGLLTITDD